MFLCRCFSFRAATLDALPNCYFPVSLRRNAPLSPRFTRLFPFNARRVSTTGACPVSTPKRIEDPGLFLPAPYVSMPPNNAQEEQMEVHDLQLQEYFPPAEQEPSPPTHSIDHKLLRYRNSRDTDPSYPRTCDFRDWLPLFQALVKEKQQRDFDDIFHDLLSLPYTLQSSILVILINAHSVRNYLDIEHLCLILHPLFKNPSSVDKLHTQCMQHLLGQLSLISHPYPTKFRQVLENSSYLISRILEHLRGPGHINAVATYKPPQTIRHTLLLSQSMLAFGIKGQILEIVKLLLDRGLLPPDAMKYLESEEDTDFRRMASLAFTSTTLFWDWPDIASRYLITLLPLYPDSEIIPSLIVDTLRRLLDSKTSDSLGFALNTIVHTGKLITIPDAIIQEFYEATCDTQQVDLAELLFLFTSDPDTIAVQIYSPPSGLPLPWLLKHLSSSKTRRRHLALRLAVQVGEHGVSIPLSSRGVLIAELAANGHAGLARQLYEQYSQGPEGKHVAGNSTLLIRLCSLFSHISSQVDARLRGNQPGGLTKRHQAMSLLELQQSADDLQKFVSLVLQSFKNNLGKMEDASHFSLTSLARAYFLLGRTSEGFRMFSILLKRNELPDSYDITVALGVVAEQSPRTAVRMMERMLEKGVQPVNVTYGTVIHHALLHGDQEVVDKLMAQMKHLDMDMTLKTTASLIRASISRDTSEDRRKLGQQLKGVHVILKRLEERGEILPARLGNHLVTAAVRAGQPVLGYVFWRMLCSLGANWTDPRQVFLRGVLERELDKGLLAGRLKPENVKSMIRMLRRESAPLTVKRKIIPPTTQSARFPKEEPQAGGRWEKNQ